MNRLMMVAGTVVLLGGIRTAKADTEAAPLDPLDPVRVISPLTLVQGDGVKVGEGTAIYPQVGLETGFESNTFYQADNPTAAGIARLLVEVGLGSLSDQRLAMSPGATTAATHGDIAYEADAYAAYDQYISGNSDVTHQGGLGLGFHGKLEVHPHQPISFLATEGFDRVLRSVNFESRTNANRDINALLLRLTFQPDGSRLNGAIQYQNSIDVFEHNDLQFSDRMMNTLLGRLSYAFLPLTQGYLQVSEGFDTGLGSSSTKVTSYPLVAVAGISTALTTEMSLAAQAGYTQGFYSSGPDYQSFVGAVYYEWRYNPISAFRARYSYEHNDSINANFYRDHAFQMWLEHKIAPVAVYVSPELRLREYQGLNGPLMGPPVRDDIIFAIAVGLRYQFRNWLTGSAEYRFADDATDYRYTSGTTMLDPSYMRHEVWAGIRIAY